jgi:hypothetical protein
MTLNRKKNSNLFIFEKTRTTIYEEIYVPSRCVQLQIPETIFGRFPFRISVGKPTDLISLGFVVPCIFKYPNKTPNQMQQSIVTFIA